MSITLITPDATRPIYTLYKDDVPIYYSNNLELIGLFHALVMLWHPGSSYRMHTQNSTIARPVKVGKGLRIIADRVSFILATTRKETLMVRFKDPYRPNEKQKRTMSAYGFVWLPRFKGWFTGADGAEMSDAIRENPEPFVSEMEDDVNK